MWLQVCKFKTLIEIKVKTIQNVYVKGLAGQHGQEYEMFHVDRHAVPFSPRSSPLTVYLLCMRRHFYGSYVDYCTHNIRSSGSSLCHRPMLISIDVYHKNANKAELTGKTERTAVGCQACQAAWNICWTHCTSVPPGISEKGSEDKRPSIIQCSYWHLDWTIREDNVSWWTSSKVQVFSVLTQDFLWLGQFIPT